MPYVCCFSCFSSLVGTATMLINLSVGSSFVRNQAPDNQTNFISTHVMAKAKVFHSAFESVVCSVETIQTKKSTFCFMGQAIPNQGQLHLKTPCLDNHKSFCPQIHPVLLLP